MQDFHFVSGCSILFHSVPSYSTMFHFVLSCSTLFYLVPLCSILFHFVLPCSTLFHIDPASSRLFHVVQAFHFVPACFTFFPACPQAVPSGSGLCHRAPSCFTLFQVVPCGSSSYTLFHLVTARSGTIPRLNREPGASFTKLFYSAFHIRPVPGGRGRSQFCAVAFLQHSVYPMRSTAVDATHGNRRFCS